MKTFEYTIKDELGIHAIPEGMLLKEVKNYYSKININRKEDVKSADASSLLAVMSLDLKYGQTV